MYRKSRVNFKNVVASVFIIIFLPGCANMTDTKRTEAEGVATGAVIGGLIGRIVGDDKKGAYIGAMIGAGVGGAYGKHVASKKKNYANREEYMEAVIAEADKLLVASRQERNLLKQDIENRKATISRLEKHRESEKDTQNKLSAVTNDIKKDIQKADTLIQSLDREIAIQQQVLDKEKQAISPQLVSQSRSNISGLEEEKRRLKILKLQLASLDSRRMY